MNQKSATSCFISFHSLLYLYLENWSPSQRTPSGKPLWTSTKILLYLCFPLSLHSGDLTTPFMLCTLTTWLATRKRKLNCLSDTQYRNYINLWINIFCILHTSRLFLKINLSFREKKLFSIFHTIVLPTTKAELFLALILNYLFYPYP